MRKIFMLAKTLLKGGGAFTAAKKSRVKYLLPFLLLFALAVFGFSMIVLTFEIYDAMAAFGIQDLILPFAFGATCVVVFIFGVFYVISTMYHAKDIELLRSLPLKPFQILGAKFITLVVYEYIMEAYILLPVLIGFGIKSGAGLLYIIYAVILLLITPVIGLCIAGVIVMIIMRFTSFGKNKQAFNFVGSILIVGLAIGLNIGMQKLGAVSQEQLAAIASGQTSLVSVVSSIFPGIVFASRALLYSSGLTGLGNLLLFIVICALEVAVFLGVGQLVYFKGVVGITESAAKRKGVSDLGRKTKRTSGNFAYLKKELRLLVRSPIGFMNCVLMNLIWPVLITVMLFSSGQFQSLKELLPAIDPKIVIAILVAANSVISSTNATASTAISREGNALYVSKYIPMEMKEQLSAKMITAFLLSSIGILIICVLAVIIGFSVLNAVVAFILSLIAAVVIAAVGLLIDVYHPKLDWMNEQQAIKQNINVVLHMMAGLASAAVIMLPVWLIPMPLTISIIYITAVLLIALLVLLRIVSTKAVTRLTELDV